jgi:hypothetical protein
MRRPLIINLWGMTGVGKTDVIRYLVKILEFSDRFIEIELNNSNQSSYYSYFNSIGQILEFNNVLPEQPNIILFDEIQRFRTIDTHGNDLPDLKYQDFWELLSDGKLARRDKGSLFDLWQNLEYKMMLEKPNEEENKGKKGKKKVDDELEDLDPKIDQYFAKRMRSNLNSSKSWMDITKLNTKEALEMVKKAINDQSVFEARSYNQSLIIVCGNIDEAYTFAGMTSEAEIDPDIFHSLTKKINLVDIKYALGKRFRPEQVSRLGNVHILYPSLNRKSFEKLIQVKIDEMVDHIEKEYKIKVQVDISINQLIFNNGVFPVQGVRPVFSTVGEIFEKYLTHFMFTALTEDFDTFSIFYDNIEKAIIGKFNTKKSIRVPFVGRIDKVRQDNSENLVSLVSVHESGHAVLYALDFGLAPLQLKSRIASAMSEGFTFSHQIHQTKTTILQKINTLLAGAQAEKIIFGDARLSTGCASDLEVATRLASEYVRKYGFDNHFKTVVATGDNANFSNTNIDKTNEIINNIIETQEKIVRKALEKHKNFLIDLARELKQKGEIQAKDFQQIAHKHKIKCEIENENFMVIDDYQGLLG